MKIQGENASFTGLEVDWVDQLPRWRDPSLRGLVQRTRTIRLQQALETGGPVGVPQEIIRQALGREGAFEDELDLLTFKAGWLKTYLTELRTAEVEPLAVHTTAKPLELRRLRLATHEDASRRVRMFIEDGVSACDVQRILHDEPHTWLDDLSKSVTDNPQTTANNIVWNDHLYELRATSGMRHAIDRHFGTEPLPFSSAP